jgi:cytochrome c-type biogenesis protein CcmH
MTHERHQSVPPAAGELASAHDRHRVVQWMGRLIPVTHGPGSLLSPAAAPATVAAPRNMRAPVLQPGRIPALHQRAGAWPSGFGGTLLALLVLVALVGPALAMDPEPPLPDPAQQAVYERLTREVRCLVCQNQTIADSTAPLAADLRREIRGLVEEGKGEEEVKDFLLARYGDFVLYRPRLRPATVALWAAPAALLVLGGFGLWRTVQRRGTLPVESDDDGDAEGGPDAAPGSRPDARNGRAA